MAGYIGAAAVPQATESRDVFTATSNQTSFATSGYTPGFVSVYLNGVHLARADYTATNGSDVVLAAGATEDDTVEIVSFSTFELSAQTFSGNVTIGDGNLVLGSTAVSSTAAELNILDGVTSTAAELNILDGVTSTAAEINLIDGGTARGTTAVADGDGFLTNDGGTMRMTKVDTLATYMGTKITGGSMVYLASSGAISNAASVSFTQFDATKYDNYQFRILHVIPATNNANLYAHASTDGGSNYDTTDGNYHYLDNDKIGFQITGNVATASNAAGASGIFDLYAPHVAKYTYGQSSTVNMITSTYASFIFQLGVQLVNQDVDALQFKFTSGNIASGEIVMYGIANGT